MPWQRPADVPLGQVWHRFQGKRDGRWYQVRDMDPGVKDECIEFMLETFLRDEPLCSILGIISDPVSIATIRSNWEGFLTQGVSLVCYSEDDQGRPDELVGFNNIVVRYKGEEEEDFDSVKGDSWRKLLKTLTVAEDLVDVYQHYGVDAYLSSSGLTVKPKCRGQNIGAHIIAARKPLCKALGLSVVVTVFTATASQVLAEKCGYELLATLPYSEMLKYGFDLSKCPTSCAQVRGIKFDFSQ